MDELIEAGSGKIKKRMKSVGAKAHKPQLRAGFYEPWLDFELMQTGIINKKRMYKYIDNLYKSITAQGILLPNPERGYIANDPFLKMMRLNKDTFDLGRLCDKLFYKGRCLKHKQDQLTCYYVYAIPGMSRVALAVLTIPTFDKMAGWMDSDAEKSEYIHETINLNLILKEDHKARERRILLVPFFKDDQRIAYIRHKQDWGHVKLLMNQSVGHVFVANIHKEKEIKINYHDGYLYEKAFINGVWNLANEIPNKK